MAPILIPKRGCGVWGDGWEPSGEWPDRSKTQKQAGQIPNPFSLVQRVGLAVVCVFRQPSAAPHSAACGTRSLPLKPAPHSAHSFPCRTVRSQHIQRSGVSMATRASLSEHHLLASQGPLTGNPTCHTGLLRFGTDLCDPITLDISCL